MPRARSAVKPITLIEYVPPLSEFFPSNFVCWPAIAGPPNRSGPSLPPSLRSSQLFAAPERPVGGGRGRFRRRNQSAFRSRNGRRRGPRRPLSLGEAALNHWPANAMFFGRCELEAVVNEAHLIVGRRKWLVRERESGRKYLPELSPPLFLSRPSVHFHFYTVSSSSHSFRSPRTGLHCRPSGLKAAPLSCRWSPTIELAALALAFSENWSSFNFALASQATAPAPAIAHR